MKFSNFEIQELIKAWLAISLAFAILLSEGVFSNEFGQKFLISAFTVGIAFLLHELAHKLVAQRYKYWAEFRAFNGMLILAILMSFLGVIFVAPGAVMIRSFHITKERNGKISAAGPLTNIVLSILFIILLILGIDNDFTRYGALINSWIALFNMIPFLNIDGQKILAWNRPVYIIMVIVSFILLALTSFV